VFGRGPDDAHSRFGKWNGLDGCARDGHLDDDAARPTELGLGAIDIARQSSAVRFEWSAPESASPTTSAADREFDGKADSRNLRFVDGNCCRAAWMMASGAAWLMSTAGTHGSFAAA
jgi:hypothetical protein